MKAVTGARLKDKNAVVIAAGAGIGKATARRYAQEGAQVIAADVNLEAAQSTASDILASGGRATALQVDATCDDSVRALMQAALDTAGSIHLLFYSAGGSNPQDAPIDTVDLAIWESTAAVNLMGCMLCVRHAVPAMRAAGGGSIVIMSSGAALRGSSSAHLYSASKGALGALTRSMAASYAVDNIRVNAICCGRVNTERVRRAYGVPGQTGGGVGAGEDPFHANDIIQRYPYWLAEPEDVANIALFLASDESRLITGAEIPANGGRSAY